MGGVEGNEKMMRPGQPVFGHAFQNIAQQPLKGTMHKLSVVDLARHSIPHSVSGSTIDDSVAVNRAV